MLQDPESKRFIQVIDYLIHNKILKSYYKLAKQLSIPQQRFSDIKAGRQLVQRKLIDDFCERYPEINKKYLIIGEEPMLNNKPTKNITMKDIYYKFDIEEVIANQLKYIALLESENVELKGEIKRITEICDRCETCKQAIEKNGTIQTSPPG